MPLVGSQTTSVIAQIALDLPLDQCFDYLAPGVGQDAIGRLAVVPFGNRLLVGLVVRVGTTSTLPLKKLKLITRVCTETPAFSAADLSLFDFCARYYHQPLGQIVLNAVPPMLRQAKAAPAPKPARMVAITDSGRTQLGLMPKNRLVQIRLLAALAAAPANEADLLRLATTAKTALAILAEHGWVSISEIATAAAPRAPETLSPPSPPKFDARYTLNAMQAEALALITAARDRFQAFSLIGITGSGKTEVYLHAMAEALARGKQALMLVPEINLSPALVRAVAARFPGAVVAQLHSGMASAPRKNAWLAAQAGQAHIVIGTRLAVFTPMPRLGIIIADEEHDGSYKQQEGLRYSARDVAVFRASEARCAVVLGSATPSFETLHNIAQARFTEIKLNLRAVQDATLPMVDFVDLNAVRAPDGLTPNMVAAIKETIARGEQALVFINRRGYAPALVCAQCGEMPGCQRCTARLAFHQKAQRLKCHHCGFQGRVPTSCEHCGSPELIAAGHGTERVEEALQRALPELRMARVDRDSTREKGSVEKVFQALEKGELDVLVGTQMLAKGHDFPKLTLVGVVNADGALFSADFRAAERLAAQLMQVAGRAGRAQHKGRVLIQTRFPQHPLYQAVASHNYRHFATIAMTERAQAHLPPFTYLALLRAESKQAERLANFMADASAAAMAVGEASVQVWDPVPPTLARKAGFERNQLMVQAHSRRALQGFLSAWLIAVRAMDAKGVKWVIDVDPIEV